MSPLGIILLVLLILILCGALPTGGFGMGYGVPSVVGVLLVVVIVLLLLGKL